MIRDFYQLCKEASVKILGLIILMTVVSVQAKTFDKKIFENTINTIKEKSYYKLTDDEIYQAAISGILKHIESKNREPNKESDFNEDANVLLPPRNVEEMKKEMKGEISGIGVGIKYDKDEGQVYPVLIDIIKNGGAASAGLLKGDQILKIDGEPVSEFKCFQDIVYKIRGKSGTKVKLSILRNGEAFTKKVERKEITWDAVEISQSSKRYSLVKINFFNEKTVATLAKELNKMKSQGTNSLILDLRENTGGLFEEGLKAIKLFAKKGETVLLAKYGKSETKEFKAETDGVGKNLKVVVLISKDTKSMGEAFTSTLKKINGATIIGEKSYGKGTMETVMNLDNDYSVKFTVGRLFTSDHRTWDKSGVNPDVVVPHLDEKNKTDHQIELAKLLISKK